MTNRNLTLAIAILGTLATAASAVAGVVPPAWALLIAAVGSGLYGLTRTLQKRAAGASWKSLLATTETWGAALVVASSIVSALAGVVPVEHAAMVAGVAAVLTRITRVLQATLAAAPVSVSDAPTKPLGPGPLAAACLLLAGSMLASVPARAESPQFGGCVANDAVCFGPSATVTVGQFNFATSKFSGGIVPGVGYGATYAQSQWYATGLAAYLSFTVGQGAPNEAIPSLMLSFANYVRVGAGVSITETAGPVETQWRLLFGVGSDFGGSPKYLAAKGGGL